VKDIAARCFVLKPLSHERANLWFWRSLPFNHKRTTELDLEMSLCFFAPEQIYTNPGLDQRTVFRSSRVTSKDSHRNFILPTKGAYGSAVTTSGPARYLTYLTLITYFQVCHCDAQTHHFSKTALSCGRCVLFGQINQNGWTRWSCCVVLQGIKNRLLCSQDYTLG